MRTLPQKFLFLILMHMDSPPKMNRNWLKYSGMAFQFFALIIGSLFLGRWIDSKMESKYPWFAFALPVLMIVGALIQIIKETGPGKK